MKILGIDPGYDRLGIAVVEKKNGKETLLFSECFTTPKEDTLPDRLLAVGHEVEKVIEKHEPECLAIETLLFNTNQKTAMAVSEARGVIVNKAKEKGLTVHDYTPPQIKIALTGYGRSEKNQVMFMVGKILSFDPKTKNDDECDAIAVALTKSAEVKA